jgi:hypothetical protein
MKNISRIALIIILAFTQHLTSAQAVYTQTIKGRVIDESSAAPVGGATVALTDDSVRSTQSDKEGRFSLTGVPVGRHAIIVSYIGYETKAVSELLVTSGKEVVVNVTLAEKVSSLGEVVIRGQSKRLLNQQMVMVSGRSFRSEEARRYAGALGDPSRMVAAFAGVSSANDSRNDIVVRGNSPSGLLWRLEGIDIPNPNHYGSLSSTGGPVSILNVNNLGKSDFLTGAFPARYGNALASVFDLQLRNGNTDHPEFLSEISFTGFELGAEGPLFHRNGSSYIVNYRYSTVGVLHSFGLNVGTGSAVPQYQDLNFKFWVPISSKNRLSIFGLGGPSHINFLGADADATNLYGAANENIFTKYFTSVVGATLETNFNQKTFGKLSVGFSHTMEDVEHDSISTVTKQPYRDETHDYKTNRFSVNYMISHKFDRRNSLEMGANSSCMMFRLTDIKIQGTDRSEKLNLDENSSALLLQGFAQFKRRFSEKLSATGGLHYQILTLNQSQSLEPRLGIQYVSERHNVLALGLGVHTQMQSPLLYFYQTNVWRVLYTNKNLGFTRSEHLVASYDYNIVPGLHLKTEVYYQDISNVPVELRPTSFSVLNEGADFGEDLKDSLVNRGTGRNYGIEWTLEKYFTKKSYFLMTASLFDSKYKGSDGIQRNTAFNTKYAINILGGKEFLVGKKNNTLTANIKLATVGGRYVSPINLEASQMQRQTVYDETVAPYSLRLSPYFRMDAKVGYRKNSKKTTLEFGIDLENLTMNKNIFMQSYSVQRGKIVSQFQQGFLPVPYFRFTF